MIWADEECAVPAPTYPALMLALLVAAEFRRPTDRPALMVPVRNNRVGEVVVAAWTAKVPVRGGAG